MLSGARLRCRDGDGELILAGLQVEGPGVLPTQAPHGCAGVGGRHRRHARHLCCGWQPLKGCRTSSCRQQPCKNQSQLALQAPHGQQDPGQQRSCSFPALLQAPEGFCSTCSTFLGIWANLTALCSLSQMQFVMCECQILMWGPPSSILAEPKKKVCRLDDAARPF